MPEAIGIQGDARECAWLIINGTEDDAVEFIRNHPDPALVTAHVLGEMIDTCQVNERVAFTTLIRILETQATL